MKYFKYMLPIVIVFLTIGFAAQNITLSVTGDAYIASDIEEFDMYISNISQNGTQNLSLLKSSDSFAINITSELEVVSITYEVTNNSSNFDALVTTKCYNENNLGSHRVTENTFEQPTLIESKQTKNGTITAGQEDPSFEASTIICEINTTPVEREVYGEGEVPPPIRIYQLGEVVSIGTEKFNVLKDNGNTVTMLAQYNLGTNYLQSTTANLVEFSEDWDSEYYSIDTDGPDILLETHGTIAYNYINNYVSNISNLSESTEIEGTLLNTEHFQILGCELDSHFISSSYLQPTTECTFLKNYNWLNNNQSTWTSVYIAEFFGSAWPRYISTKTEIEHQEYYDTAGVRPVITIPKSAIKN